MFGQGSDLNCFIKYKFRVKCIEIFTIYIHVILLNEVEVHGIIDVKWSPYLNDDGLDNQ